MSKRILVILGHPANESFCGALADSYVKGAKAAGNEVQLISLGHLSFDPVLHNGYATIQELEPDLVAAQAAITWASLSASNVRVYGSQFDDVLFE